MRYSRRRTNRSKRGYGRKRKIKSKSKRYNSYRLARGGLRL